MGGNYLIGYLLTHSRVGLVATLFKFTFFFFLLMKFYFNWESSMFPNLLWGHGSISGDPALPHPDCLSELSLAMAGPDGMTDVIGPQACLVQWKYSPSGC